MFDPDRALDITSSSLTSAPAPITADWPERQLGEHAGQPYHDEQRQAGPDAAEPEVEAHTVRPRQEREERAGQRQVAQEPHVAGADQHPVQREHHAGSGCMATNHGQAAIACACTCGSALNSEGRTPAPAPIRTANTVPQAAPSTADRGEPTDAR